MPFDSNGGVTEKELSEMEEELGFRLPDDYRKFLLEHNGGRFRSDSRPFTFEGYKSCCDELFSLRRAFSRSFFSEDEIEQGGLKNALLIGCDGGGDTLLLICDPKRRGVYYYDCDCYMPESSKEKNTYFIAKTFREFCEMLKFDPEGNIG